MAIVFGGFFFSTLFSYPLLAILYVLCALTIVIGSYTISGRLGGSIIDWMLGTGRRQRQLREQLSADLARTKESKRQGDFDQALRLVNEYLEKDPDYPEALFLKAQILTEGFGKSAEARRNLKKIMQMIPESEAFYRWALNYYNELKEMEEKGRYQ
ncbi:MAG: tetratricopeptide repeat protein [Deltaproteobacteria bacterium]|nr:tetratricopeptide repeat protein [Deltaproteobacteria bacterium]